MSKILLKGRFLKFLGGVVVAAVCIGSFYSMGDVVFRESANLWHGLASRNWDRTVGTIEASVVLTKKSKGTAYIPLVNYRYMIDGRVYRSSRIEATGSYSEERAYMLLRDFPEQAEVTVFYDRESGLSALLTGVRADTYFRLAVGLVLMITLPGFFLLVLHAIVKTPATESYAQWRVIRRDGFRNVRDMDPEEFERRVQFDLAVEREIAERKNEIARKKDVK
jgi:hypothetical protein